MGRRSLHSPEELRLLILNAAESIVQDGGLAALSARSIARTIGYAPGTLYNAYDNIQDIVLRVAGRLLDRLDAHLATEMDGLDGHSALRAFAAEYLVFARRHACLWSMLREGHAPPSPPPPDWYLTKLQAPIARLRTPLSEVLDVADQMQIDRRARAYWNVVHALSLSVTTSTTVSERANDAMLEDVFETYLAGVTGLAGVSGPPRQFQPNAHPARTDGKRARSSAR